MRWALALPLFAFAGLFSFAGAAAQASPIPCEDTEYRQLDFWVGEWRAEWDNSDGTVGVGRNSVTKGEFGDCVIYERFSGAGLNGVSVSTFVKRIGAWRQTWVDDQGGYFNLTGGINNEGDSRFELLNERLSEKGRDLRMIWQNVSDDAFVWRWQSRASDSDEWVDSWVIRYSRITDNDAKSE